MNPDLSIEGELARLKSRLQAQEERLARLEGQAGKWLELPEAAKADGVPLRTALLLAREGKVVQARIGGRTLIPQGALGRALMNFKVEAAA